MATDTTVRCDKCGCEQRVSFAACLASGWPECCGYTMRLGTTKADIAEAIDRIFEPVRAAIHQQDTDRAGGRG